MSLTTFSGPVVSQNGFIDTSFTTAERDALVDPQPGLLIYNTDTNTYQVCTVGGGAPTWDSAFGGGGGGGSWPFSLDNRVSITSYTPGGDPYYGPIVFNPTGTQYVSYGDPGAMGFELSYTNLAVPFAVNTATTGGYMSGSGTYSLNGNALIGGYYNANGSEFYTVHNDGMGSVTVGAFSLSAPYDASTGFYTFNFQMQYAGSFAGALGFSMSEDGTKATFLFLDNNVPQVTVMNLATAFDLSTAQYGSQIDISSYFQNIVPFQNSSYTRGIALNSSGTVAFVPGFFSGMQGGGTYVVELRLGTAFDFSSINASYSQQVSGAASVQSYGNVSLASSKIYIVGQFMGMNWGLDQFNLTAIAAPNITGVSPSSGPYGTSATITGTGFTGTTQVLFGPNSTGGNYTVDSNTQITAVVPNGPGATGTVDVTVTNPAGSSTEVAAFTYTVPLGETFNENVDWTNTVNVFGGMSTQINPNNPTQRFINATFGNAAAGKSVTLTISGQTWTGTCFDSNFGAGQITISFTTVIGISGVVTEIFIAG